MKLTCVSRLLGRRSLGASSGSVVPLTLRQSIAAALSGNAGLVAIVGANIFPCYIPENDNLPALYYQVRGNAMGRNLAGPDGTALAKVTFTAESKNIGQDEAAVEAIRQFLDCFPKRTPLGASNGVIVIGAFQDDDDDAYDEPDDDTDRGTYTTVTTYAIRYRKPKPARFGP